MPFHVANLACNLNTIKTPWLYTGLYGAVETELLLWHSCPLVLHLFTSIQNSTSLKTMGKLILHRLSQVNTWVEFVFLAVGKVIRHVSGEAAIFFLLSQVASEPVGSVLSWSLSPCHQTSTHAALTCFKTTHGKSKKHNTHTYTHTTLLYLHICVVMVIWLLSHWEKAFRESSRQKMCGNEQEGHSFPLLLHQW